MIQVDKLTERLSTTRYKRKVIERIENDMKVFRIIPHSDVATNTKRLWRTIHKMYELYESPRSRIERDGFRFTIREKDYFWFDVVFRQVDGEKKVEFYVSTTEYQAEKLKRKIENKLSVTFKDAKLEDLYVPDENTIVQELRYLKHDIFSLKADSKEVKTPVASLLSTVEELQHDGDVARFSICGEVENRAKWVRNAQYAYETVHKGKVPQRAKVNGKLITTYLKTFIATIVNELNSLLVDVFQALQTMFLKSEHAFEKRKVVDKAYSLEDEIGTTRLNREKGNLPVIKAHIRIAAHSEDQLTRDSLAESLALSTQDLSDANELHGFKVTVNGKRVKILHEMNTLQLSAKTKLDPNVNLVSTDEMSKLALMMPNRELQIKYSEALDVQSRVQVEVPSEVLGDDKLLIGHAELKDRKIPVGINAKNKEDFYSGYAFIGKKGSGKDTAIQNFVREAVSKNNDSFFILDWICEEGDRGMADGIRDMLPPDRIIDIDYGNSDWIVPMDLSEVVSKLDRKGGSRFATEMIDFMQLDDKHRSRKYLLGASKAANGSLFGIKRMIEEEPYRKRRIEELRSEGNIRLADEIESWGGQANVEYKCEAIQNRLSMFFGDDTLYDVFSQPPKKEVDFEQWMREGKVVIIRMPRRVLGNAAKILAHWVTLKVLMTRLLMSKADIERHGCFVVFNEPEQVESEGLAELMGRIATEGRKERLGSIFAFHHWGKLPPYLQDNLLAGGVNQFLFATDHKKTVEMAKDRLAPTFTVEDALRTPKHYAIAILNTKEPLHAFMVKMLPPIPKSERQDNSFLTKRHAQMYGRSWEELQKLSS